MPPLLHTLPLPFWHEFVFASHGSGLPGGSDGKASVYNAGDLGSIPGSGRSARERNGNPLQYSCLGKSMDRGAWQATVHGVAKSQTRVSDFTFLPFLMVLPTSHVYMFVHIFIFPSSQNGLLPSFQTLKKLEIGNLFNSFILPFAPSRNCLCFCGFSQYLGHGLLSQCCQFELLKDETVLISLEAKQVQ